MKAYIELNTIHRAALVLNGWIAQDLFDYWSEYVQSDGETTGAHEAFTAAEAKGELPAGAVGELVPFEVRDVRSILFTKEK